MYLPADVAAPREESTLEHDGRGRREALDVELDELEQALPRVDEISTESRQVKPSQAKSSQATWRV